MAGSGLLLGRGSWLLVLWLLPSLLLANSAKQVFVYNNTNIPKNLDPALVSDAYSRNILMQIFEGLTTYHPRDLSPQPGVAQRWTVSLDKRTYTFYLNKLAKWSDGTSVTAADFVYAWQRVLDRRNHAPLASNLYPIRNARAYHKGELNDFGKVGVRAVAPDVLEVHLESPTPYFLELTSFYTLFPVARNWLQSNPQALISSSSPIVSNGPFVLLKGSNAQRMVLKKNPLYWNSAQVRLEEIRVEAIQDVQQALELYRAGKMDYTGETPIPAQELPRWRYTSDFHEVPWFAVNFLRMNTTRKPFDNVQVRKALALAIDKAKIINYIIPGGHQVANSMVPVGMRHYTPPQLESYNPGLARSLFAQAGYCVPGNTPSGSCKVFPTVTMLVDNNDSEKKLVLSIQQMLKKELGIEQIQIKVINNYQDFLGAIMKMDYDIARSRWIGDYQDPNTFLEIWTSDHPKNSTGWKNAQFDDLIRQAAVEQNGKRRMEFFAQAEALLLAELPIIPIYDFSHVYLLKPYVKNYTDNIRRVMLLKDVYIEHYKPNVAR